MNIAKNDGDFQCHTKQELEDMIRTSALNPYDDIWIYGENKSPCLAILVNGSNTCVHYFANDNGDMWQSVGDCKEEILFAVNGETPDPMPGNCVIPLDKAIACVNLFFDTLQMPDCIEWREL